MSVTFADSATRYGVLTQSGVDSIIVRIGEDGRPIHKVITDRTLTARLDTQVDVYVASGGFSPGSVTAYQGRSKANVKRVWFLPFDCDLADFLTMTKDEVYSLSQDEIDGYLPDFVEAATSAITAQGLPISGVEYTGHGILVRVRLSYPDSDRVMEIDAALKAIVKRINTAAGFPLIDPSGTDAGTRIVRIVGSLNGKSLKYGQPARQTRSLFESDETLRVADLLRIAAEPRKGATVTPILADHGKRLSDADAQAVVDAVAPHWQLGVKHKAALSLAGRLTKAGVPEAQALAIIEALAANDEKPWDRAKCVASSYARMRAGANVLGYFGLAAWLPQDAVDFLDQKLESFRMASAPRIVLTGQQSKEADGLTLEQSFTRSFERTIAPVPESAFYGWFGDYRNLMKGTTAAPDQFHLGASLVLASAMTNRRVVHSYNSEALGTNVFVALIGRTGTTYKDTSMKRALEQFPHNCPPNRVVHPEFQFLRDISSQQGLIKNLSEKTNAVLKMSELTTMLRNAKRKGTETIIDALITAWDGGVLENNSKGEPASADAYQLNVIAATQPGRLANEMTSEEIESGFANRWIYIFGSGKPPIAITEELNRPEAGRLYLELFDHIDRYRRGTVLKLNERSKELWIDWFTKDQASIREDGDEDRADMRARHANLIRKIALIYAISDGASEIDDRHLQPAIEFIAWMWGEVKAVMRSWGASMDIKLEERIREVLSGGAMSRRDLQRRIGGNKFSARDFAITLEAMAKNRTVEIDPTGMVVLT